ncbi:hypothetical protein [Fibrella forsythiae]|uniref:DUF2029 domain-containing protein n=1 Tax=Fibrella forsythiae TaxID=2817061 RepID=A0ABS3JGU5_9BACT|nr:hypothetical protein [Fibrella forsythiae]MBO0949226.1 hypothetical protein [Fibrella forsythiae]
MLILLVKGISSLLLTLAIGLLLWQRTRVEQLLGTKKAPWISLFFVVFRLLPFLGTYVVMGFEPQSDVQCFYPIVSSATRFEIPYVGAYNAYSPFFGYLLALPLAIYDNIRVIVLTLLLLETVTVWLTQRLYLPQLTQGERLFRCLIYYMLPVSFIFAVFSGQEDILVWGVALAGVWLWQTRQNAFLGGVALGIGLLLTKATFVLLMIPLFLLTRRKVAFVAGAAVVGLPVLVWLYLTTGTLFMDQPLHEGDYLKAPNWRSVLNPVLVGNVTLNGNLGKWITLALLLVVIIGTTFWVRKREALTGYLPTLYIAIFAAMSVLQQNAITVYAFAFMLPLVFCLTNFRDKTEVAILLIFNLLAANHPSIWWRMKQPYYTFSSLSNPLYLAEYVMEWLIIAGFAWCVWLAIRQLRRGPVPTLPA